MSLFGGLGRFSRDQAEPRPRGNIPFFLNWKEHSEFRELRLGIVPVENAASCNSRKGHVCNAFLFYRGPSSLKQKKEKETGPNRLGMLRKERDSMLLLPRLQGNPPNRAPIPQPRSKHIPDARHRTHTHTVFSATAQRKSHGQAKDSSISCNASTGLAPHVTNTTFLCPDIKLKYAETQANRCVHHHGYNNCVRTLYAVSGFVLKRDTCTMGAFQLKSLQSGPRGIAQNNYTHKHTSTLH